MTTFRVAAANLRNDAPQRIEKAPPGIGLRAGKQIKHRPRARPGAERSRNFGYA